MGTVVGIIQGQKFVDQFLRLLKAQTVIAFDRRLAGQDEVIEFKHTAYSKAVFGKGAVEAAKFLAWKPAGRYDMSDVIQL